MKTNFFTAFVAAAALAPAPFAAANPTATTTAADLLMYAIDADTDQLVRYRFETDSYETVGVVTNAAGQAVRDMESLVHIPAGPNAGLYTVPRQGDDRWRLVKIDPVTAAATVYASRVLEISGTPVEVDGMMAHFDTGSGSWKIRATLSTHAAMIDIDPATGAGTVVQNLARGYAGVTQGPDGTVFGIKSDDVYRINADGSETQLNSHTFGKTEALEYAFGDNAPEVTMPGIPASWTADGVLFAFSDDRDQLLVLNPANGDAHAYPGTFPMVDCEGIVFVTKLQNATLTMSEPLYD